MSTSSSTSATEAELALIRRVVAALLRPRAQPPQLARRFSSIGALHDVLQRDLGFRLTKKQLHYALPTFEDGAASRPLLVWRQGRVIVKAKPRGEGDKPGKKPGKHHHRYGLPHVSVCLVSGKLAQDGTVDTDYEAETHKADCHGVLRSKAAPHPKIPDAMTASLQESWADETHFLFPDLVCDESDMGRLVVGRS